MRIRRTRMLFITFPAVAACSSSSTQPTTVASEFSGQYSIILTRSAAQCGPQPLPGPVSSDTNYVQVPAVRTSSTLSVQVQLNGSSILLTPGSSSAIQLSSVPLSGRFEAPTALLTLTATQTEGPRAGGHTFSVSKDGADSVTFLSFVETPPGNRAEVTVTGSGTGTFAFRDGGPTGPVFTTCTFTDSISGTKIS